MELQTLQGITLLAALLFMLAQLSISNKTTSHILFAIFSGSVAMSLAKGLSGESIGAYKYIIGMAACATCNCYWLFSRTLFRKDKSIAAPHLLLAAVIALLIMLNQGYLFATSSEVLIFKESTLAKHALSEITVLLSSCILVLSFWEGCRGFSKASKTEQAQRLLFLTTYGGAVSISKASNAIFASNPAAQEMTISVIILFVLINTQILLIWREKTKQQNQASAEEQISSATNVSPIKTIDESDLALKVKSLIDEQKLYLEANLKIADVARALGMPEYRISNALRHNLNAKNFNQYINEFRIEYAQSLLADPDKNKWPVLVIGLESGFASVGPFTRAFKAKTGFTPNQYRQKFNQLEAV